MDEETRPCEGQGDPTASWLSSSRTRTPGRSILFRRTTRVDSRRERSLDRRYTTMVLAADYPLLDVFWTTMIFTLWVIWFWLLITVFADIFRRHDLSGWAKTLWIVFAIVLPYLGVFVYLISQGRGMTERKVRETEAARMEFDDHIRSVSANGSAPAAEIEKASQLLGSGAITQTEYEAIKQKALA